MEHKDQVSPTLGDYVKKLDKVVLTKGVKLTDLHKVRGTMSGEVRRNGRPISIGQEEGGIFENVAEHTAMAMLITDVLGEKLGLSGEERANVNIAAWLHDSGKKTERMWQRAIEEAEAQGDEAPLFQGESDVLHEQGRRKKVALENIARMEEWENAEEAGISPRANELMKANVPPSENGHGDDMSAKIIWFADACLSGTAISPIGARFDDLESDERNGARNIAFSESFKDVYDGQSLYQVQRKLGQQYEEEFAERLGISSKDLYRWLISQVDAKIQSQQLPTLPK